MTRERVSGPRRAEGPGDGGNGSFVDLLRENGVKVTPQRLEILRYLDTTHEHPSADTIYRALKDKNPSLSKTTVYNNLDLLHSLGVVSVLNIAGSELRYELDTGMHHHLMCRACGRIYNIDVSCPYLDGMLHGEHKVEEVHGYFKGVCKGCLTDLKV